MILYVFGTFQKLGNFLDGTPGILFNASSTVGFGKEGYSVDDLDLRVA